MCTRGRGGESLHVYFSLTLGLTFALSLPPRIMLPSFSAASIRPLVPLFFDKAFELKDKLLRVALEDSDVAAKTGEKNGDATGEGEVDVMQWIGR